MKLDRALHAETRPTRSTTTTGIKRQIIPDSVMTVRWEEQPSDRKRHKPYPELLDAEFQVAEVAWRRAAENVQQTYEKPEKCQVCSLSRDKWFCRLPLYLNAHDEPVNLPGSFCSKACFERI